jgi:hypothetical protein
MGKTICGAVEKVWFKNMCFFKKFKECVWATKETNLGNSLLKGQCHEIFCFCFFMNQYTPSPRVSH